MNAETATTSEALAYVAPHFTVTSYTQDLGYHGGTGGTGSRVACRAGDIAVGFYGSYGNFINELGLVCAALGADGTTGPRYTTAVRGTPGPHSFRFECPTFEKQ